MADHPTPQPAPAPDHDLAQFDAEPHPLTINYAPRSIVMRYVAEHELDMVASLGSSIHLTFFGVCAGVFASFVGVMLGAEVKDPMKHATCSALIFVSGVGVLFFGIFGVKAYLESRKKLNELKHNR